MGSGSAALLAPAMAPNTRNRRICTKNRRICSNLEFSFGRMGEGSIEAGNVLGPKSCKDLAGSEAGLY